MRIIKRIIIILR